MVRPAGGTTRPATFDQLVKVESFFDGTLLEQTHSSPGRHARDRRPGAVFRFYRGWRPA